MILPHFDVQGHRGARGLRPENTLPSFEAALDAGATSLECDVHVTADGVPVLIHDPWVHDGLCRRINGTAIVRRPVHEMTAAELAPLVADRNPAPARFPRQGTDPSPLVREYFGPAGHEYSIPTLAALFDFARAYAGELGPSHGKTDAQRDAAARVVFDVEIKRYPFRESWGREHDRRIVDVIRASGCVDRSRIRSFDHRTVRAAVEMEPRLTGVVLVEGTALVDPVTMTTAAGATIYGPDIEFLDEETMRRCQESGIAVIPWTVNDEADWERLVEWGVDGITTDVPDRLAAWLRSRLSTSVP